MSSPTSSAGPQGYALIASSDQQRVAPGAQDLAALFTAHAPCLILVDEWVAYARNLVSNATLPAGTFDSQVSFAQALTEAVKQVPNALLLISVPQSVNEIGGSDGEKAARCASRTWSPASPTSGGPPPATRASRSCGGGCSSRSPPRRPAPPAMRWCAASPTSIRQNPSEFPAETREAGYRDLLISAYPIHPELFKRLYDDWSTLDRFQRTRGVLRLLALTIEGLWNGNSKDLLIMPSSIPIDDNDVKNELVRFLDNQWEPIISQDVDGPQSTPTRLDTREPQLRPRQRLQAGGPHPSTSAPPRMRMPCARGSAISA